MSKIKNGGLDQHGAERFQQQQFGTAGVEGVNTLNSRMNRIESNSRKTNLLVLSRSAQFYCKQWSIIYAGPDSQPIELLRRL